MADSTLFLVRVWRQLAAFRVSVRRVDDADTHVFRAADDVARFLQQAAEPASEAAASDDEGTTPADHFKEHR